MPSDYDQIRKDNFPGYERISRALSLLSRLYTDRTHFIFELLQNAEDTRATRVLFHLFENKLEVFHDGRGFCEKDVRAICGVGEGTKTEDLTQIGRFGVGFKSVYVYTTTPEIYSEHESFKIEHYVLPYAVDPRDIGDSWTTLFVFPFNKEDVGPEIVCKKISEKLRKLNSGTLLFLRNIKRIEYRLPDGMDGVYLRDEAIRGAAREVTVTGKNDGEDESKRWLIFKRPVEVPDSGGDCPPVEIGFHLVKNEKECRDEIVRVRDSPLVVYFPTEKETKFGFLIQGPYKTTPARDNIPKEDEWNATLVRETANLIADVLLHIKDLDLLSISLLEALPIRLDYFPPGNMFYPIAVAVREALTTQELLPADGGSFVSARNAKLARSADLIKLLDHDQLRDLFPSGDTVKWLAGIITQNQTYELYRYLLDVLKVEEVTPESFSRKITESFLLKQVDEWLLAFYGYLSGQKALWRSPRWSGDSEGHLRSKPIVRLQNGSQVKPFREDEYPNAYLTDGSHTETSLPVVKSGLCRHKEAQQFLRDLGIPELDLVEEVIEKVLPKYANDDSVVTIEEHQHDILKIEKAYGTDSLEKKSRLQERLRETPFVRTESQGDRETIYRKPCKLYFESDELRLYFFGNSAIGFVNPEYSESVRSLFKDLGVADFIRVCRKREEWGGYVTLEDCHSNHERGLDGFDPDIYVQGLEFALTSLTLDKIKFIWNNIAVPHSSCIRGEVESCSRKTYEDSSVEDRISDIGCLLIKKAWLPCSDGSLKKPDELTLDDLPKSFIWNEKLAEKLGMKRDVVTKLSEAVGLPAEDIELLKRYPKEFQQWKENMSANKQKPAFPERSSSNSERRQEKLSEQLGNSPIKNYEPRARSVRTTRSAVDPALWLRNQYKNEAEQMICQICKEEMPFRKRDGEYYFEAVEALTKNYFPMEHEEQFLALCPLCAAMYKEFVKLDEEAMVVLKGVIKNTDECEAPLCLGKLDTNIRFVETHFQALKTILEDQE